MPKDFKEYIAIYVKFIFAAMPLVAGLVYLLLQKLQMVSSLFLIEHELIFWPWLAYALAGLIYFLKQMIQVKTQSDLSIAETSLKNLEIQSRNRELTKEALTDPLTGIHNRRFATVELKTKLETFAKIRRMQSGINAEQLSSGFFLIDIDFFKKINDTHGHDAGDIVLKHFANLLKNSIRQSDRVIRWGGEEFLIVLDEIGAANLENFAKKVLEQTRQQSIKIASGKELHITCSIGYARFPVSFSQPKLIDFAKTVAFADLALYHAKENGRDRAIEMVATQQLMSATEPHVTTQSPEELLQEGYIRFRANSA